MSPLAVGLVTLVIAAATPQALAQAVAAAPLVRLTDGGEFVEVERSADFSIVEVRQAPPGGVAASMFTLRGACAVARARSQRFFTSTTLPGPFATYRLTFPQAPAESQLTGPTKTIFTLAECEALRF